MLYLLWFWGLHACHIWLFPKIRGPLWVILIIRALLFLRGPILGLLMFGSSHIPCIMYYIRHTLYHILPCSSTPQLPFKIPQVIETIRPLTELHWGVLVRAPVFRNSKLGGTWKPCGEGPRGAPEGPGAKGGACCDLPLVGGLILGLVLP